MVDEKLVKTIQSTFTLYGLVLPRKLSIALAKELSNVNENERITWLTQIIEKVLAQNLSDPHIIAENLKSAIQECVRPNTLKDKETIINVIDAFNVPKIEYNLFKRKFVLSLSTPDIYNEAQHKTNMFKQRFELLWYKTMRHELFNPPELGEKKENWVELIPIEHLLSGTRGGKICVMGLLTQLLEGQYYLEDTGGIIKVDLKKADGLIMDCSIVIAKGNYMDDVLYVEELGFPPAEPSNNARTDFGDTNIFGGPNSLSLKFSEKLKRYENSNPNGIIIFAAEIWLDDSLVLSKLNTMLEGYAECPPIAFVLCGHFLSSPVNLTSTHKLKKALKNLSEIIKQYPGIKESSKFIFVPASDDIGSAKILPRPPIPKHVTKDFTDAIPGAIFTTNPSRIQYCTKEIIVLREDVLTKMCRNTIKFECAGNSYDQYAKSIICQSHLTPLNLSIVPVYWKYDHALQINPTPDLIVSADKFESYQTKFSNCHIINPGLFPKNNHSFKVYVPSLDLIEHSGIPAGDGD